MNIENTFTLAYFILLFVGLIIGMLGFKKYIYFSSVGYSLTIATFGITMLVMYAKYMSLSVLFACILLIIYGGRGGILLLTKERNSSSYRRFISEKTKDGSSMSVFIVYITWLLLTILYTFQVAPIFYTISTYARVIKKLNMAFIKTNHTNCIIGAFIMAIGLFIINFSDLLLAKKGVKKKKRLNNTGFFEFIRGGNFIGDLIFWTGVLIFGFKEMSGTIQKAIAIIGYVFIIFFIFGGAKRIFKK